LYGAHFLRAVGREWKSESMFRKCKLSNPPTREELALLRQFREDQTVADPPQMWEALREEANLHFLAMVENAERAMAERRPEIAKASLQTVRCTPEIERLLPTFAKRYLLLEKSLGSTLQVLPTASDAVTEPPADLRCLLVATEGDRLSTLRPRTVSTGVHLDCRKPGTGYSDRVFA